MIRTKQDFDHVVASLQHPHVERRVRLSPHGPEVDAVVSNHQLYIASYEPQGVRWVLVQREYLADSVHRPQPSSPHFLSGGRTPTASHAASPTMPLTSWVHAPFASRLEGACIASYTPSRWDTTYLGFLTNQSHHWYASNGASSSIQSHTEAQNAPRETLPAEVRPATMQTVDVQHSQSEAATVPAAPVPQRPLPRHPSGSSGPGVIGHQNLAPRPLSDGSEAPAHTPPKHLIKTPRRVDAATGRITKDPNATLIPLQTQYYRRLVDATTGKPATSDTVNPISRRRYYYKELQQRMVDAQTGLPATTATSPTVSYHQFRRRQLVDADTGHIATEETTNKITRSAYLSRRHYAMHKFKGRRQT